MPREPKKTDNRTPGETVPRQFRLKAATLDDLDAIAAHLARTTGLGASRADAIRYAARRVAANLGRQKNPKKSTQSA